jgi:hypothetical protein
VSARRHQALLSSHQWRHSHPVLKSCTSSWIYACAHMQNYARAALLLLLVVIVMELVAVILVLL